MAPTPFQSPGFTESATDSVLRRYQALPQAGGDASATDWQKSARAEHSASQVTFFTAGKKLFCHG